MLSSWTMSFALLKLETKLLDTFKMYDFFLIMYLKFYTSFFILRSFTLFPKLTLLNLCPFQAEEMRS